MAWRDVAESGGVRGGGLQFQDAPRGSQKNRRSPEKGTKLRRHRFSGRGPHGGGGGGGGGGVLFFWGGGGGGFFFFFFFFLCVFGLGGGGGGGGGFGGVRAREAVARSGHCVARVAEGGASRPLHIHKDGRLRPKMPPGRVNAQSKKAVVAIVKATVPLHAGPLTRTQVSSSPSG